MLGVAKYVALEHVRAAIATYPSYMSGHTGEQYTRDVITPALDESSVSHSSSDVRAGYDAAPYILPVLGVLAAGLTPHAVGGATRGLRKLAGALDDTSPGVAGAGRALGSGAVASAAKAAKTACFVMGTPVSTDKGPKPIEEVRVGDRVLSRDEATGEVSYQAVVDTFVRHDVPTLELTFEGAGATERVVTTGEHPFWVVDRGWVEARALRPGDVLFSSTGGWLRVGSATWTGHTATVYNFEVAGTHTYFVGDAAVWVHNAKCNIHVQSPAPDSATKGVHIDVYVGKKGDKVELSAWPDGDGGVEFVPVFSKDSGRKAEKAIEIAQDALANNQGFRDKLRDTAERTAPYIEGVNEAGRRNAPRVRELADTLANFGSGACGEK